MSVMFNKVLKVELIALEEGQSFGVGETIQTPILGRKPMISVKGKMTGATEVATIELRITNLYTAKLFSDYKAVKITAGYKDGEQAEIYGSIMNGFIETAPPDSVTVFEVLIGNLNKWAETWITRSFEKGTQVRAIFSEFAKLLELDLYYAIGKELLLKANMDFNCLVQDAIFKIKKAFPNLVVRPDYKILSVSDEDEGSQKVFKVDYIKSAKKDASGFTIMSIWNPAIRPMDIVELNPVYFKQAYGGQNVSGTQFTVITIDFEFDTRTTNSMTMVTVEAA